MRTAAHEWAANGTRRISQGLVAAKALAIGNQSTISLTSLANGAPKHGRESRLPALERQKLSFEPSPSPFPSGYILLDRRIDRPVPGRPAYTPSIAHRMSVQGAESKAAKPISMRPSFHFIPPKHPTEHQKGCSLTSTFAPLSFTLHVVGKGLFCLPEGSIRLRECFGCPQYRVFDTFGT